jgi:phospholipid/cholesterol/gamma-HCH transport system substrate-binding protein
MGELMDQSKSNNEQQPTRLQQRRLTVEFYVGLFTLVGSVAAAWLAVGLGGVDLFSSDKYDIYAEFDNISGLKQGASVEIAGVQIGEVSQIALDDPMALVTLRIHDSIKIREDDIASIRTKGIIGDRYVKISRGASDDYIPEGGRIIETESVVDIEDIIGKLVHNLTSDEEEDEVSKTTTEQ